MNQSIVRGRITAVFFTLLAVVLLGSVSVSAAVTISKTSATIKKGSSVTLKIMDNGKEVSGAVWGSSDTSVATVSAAGKVTGKLRGSAVITATYNGSSLECLVSVVGKTTSKMKRYNVLILDRSGSMRGSPLRQVKIAARRFAKTVLNADGKNYVAVVTLGSDAGVACEFTTSYKKVAKAINGITAGGHTNMRSAFEKADGLLCEISSGKNTVKNVILCSDGLPERGSKLAKGKYSRKDHKYYQFANSVYKLDRKMKRSDFVYALGFFHNSKGKNLKFGKRLMKDLASRDKYYIIQDSNDVSDAFDDIATQIISVTLSDKEITLYVGNKKTLKAYLNGVKTTASWSSDNPSIATVTQKGVVKGIAPGTTTVRATVKGKTVTCRVTVKEKPAQDITDEFLLYGDAVRLDDGTIRLTECKTWQGGSAWYPKSFKTGSGLTITFKYWAGGGRDQSYGGADGIVLNLADKTGLGAEGGDIGFAGNYGVELDSYVNGHDPGGKHIAIIQKAVSNHLVYKLDDRVDDSAWHTVKVVYKSKTLYVYLDGTLVLKQSGVELSANTYLGLSAATGDGINEHKVKEFKVG